MQFVSQKVELQTVLSDGYTYQALHLRVSENRGTVVPILGVPFYSIWSIKGVPLFWEMPMIAFTSSKYSFWILNQFRDD